MRHAAILTIAVLRRAHAVKQWLVPRGVGESRIRTVAYGEERPADPGPDEPPGQRTGAPT